MSYHITFTEYKDVSSQPSSVEDPKPANFAKISTVNDCALTWNGGWLKDFDGPNDLLKGIPYKTAAVLFHNNRFWSVNFDPTEQSSHEAFPYTWRPPHFRLLGANYEVDDTPEEQRWDYLREHTTDGPWVQLFEGTIHFQEAARPRNRICRLAGKLALIWGVAAFNVPYPRYLKSCFAGSNCWAPPMEHCHSSGRIDCRLMIVKIYPDSTTTREELEALEDPKRSYVIG